MLDYGSMVLVFNYCTNNPVSKSFTLTFSYLYISCTLFHCLYAVSFQTRYFCTLIIF